MFSGMVYGVWKDGVAIVELEEAYTEGRYSLDAKVAEKRSHE